MNTTENKLHPVYLVVQPLKVHAEQQAADFAVAFIAKQKEKMKAAGWDLNVAAPYPKSYGVGAVNRLTYKKMLNERNVLKRIFRMADVACNYSIFMMEEAPEREEEFVKEARELASLQYDAFVAKLLVKIGPCDAASLEGSHVWSYSVLTVNKGSTVERWKTRTILNISKLGTVFNQWPTRKM